MTKCHDLISGLGTAESCALTSEADVIHGVMMSVTHAIRTFDPKTDQHGKDDYVTAANPVAEP